MAMFPALMNDSIFSNLFDDPFFTEWPTTRRADRRGAAVATSMMNTDVREKDDSYVVDIDMPGFRKEDIRVELKNGCLTVSAHREGAAGDGSDASASADGKWLRRERYSGSCSRSFYVGDDVEEGDIHAKFENGTLSLTLPKKQAHPQVEESHTIAIEG